jgi:hypothetical protein
MRMVAALFLLLHGVAHLVGFRAAFWPSAKLVAKSSLWAGVLPLGPLAIKSFGVGWLLLALAYFGSAGLLLVGSASFTHCALWTTALSLALCALFWPEAKVGLFIDAALLVALTLHSRGTSAHLSHAFREELRVAALPNEAGSSELIDEAALAHLPEPVRRYLRFMGAVGRPRDWSLRARFVARFRREPGEWLNCEAVQYDTRRPLSRVFYMRLSLGGVLPVTVRDVYLKGHGRMSAKAFDWVSVAEGTGYELDVGELVTYLNDAILMAPSLLLGPEATWREVDPRSFDVTLKDDSLAATARVWLDENGAPVDFSTTDRFYDRPDGRRVRTEWRTPVEGWQDAQGRRLPTRARAVWHLASGPFPYADFVIDPKQIDFNVPPPR